LICLEFPELEHFGSEGLESESQFGADVNPESLRRSAKNVNMDLKLSMDQARTRPLVIQ
jgi:hypothetical protein